MKSLGFHFLVVASLAHPAFSQTTNFTPKAPPRSYNAVVRLAFVELNEAKSDDQEAETLFVPNMGQRLQPQSTQGGASSGMASWPAGARATKRPADSDHSNQKPTLSEIAAGEGRGNNPAVRAGSVVSEIMKQRAVSQKASTKVSEAEAQAKLDDAAAAKALGLDADTQAGLKKGSLWHTADEMAAILANQRRAEAAGQAAAGDSPDPFSRNVRDGSAGGIAAAGSGFLPDGRGPDLSVAPAAPSLSRSQDSDRNSTLFGSGSPAFFGAAHVSPQNGSLSAPSGGGLYSRDESLYRAPAAPNSVFGGGFGAGDLKKPTTLPW